MLGKRRAVVLLGSASRSDGHIPLCHRQGAVDRFDAELGCHVVACGVFYGGRTGHIHGIGPGVRPLGFRRQAGDRVLAALDGEGGFLQAGNALLRAVVLVAAAVGLHRDLVLGVVVGDRQDAFGLGNGVVLSLGVRLQRVGECVLAAAYLSLAAGEGVGCAFARYPTVFLRKSGSAVDQCRAVVGLAQVGGLQRHCTLGDPQRSVNPRNISKRCCRGAVIFVHYCFCTDYFVNGYAGICL